MVASPARILIIAGSDSGGGAGIQADIKTVTMLGGFAMTAITAVTAQNTLGVQGVFCLPASCVEQQFLSVIDDIGVDAVKIGMLADPTLVLAVRDLLFMVPDEVPIIIDPVMLATSGDALNSRGTAASLSELFSFATLITPNLPELESLGGEAALLAHGCTVLVKGGHGEGDVITDRLINADGEVARWSDRRIDTRHTHGTGCTLSAAIACGLGQGMSMVDAVARARQFVRAALLAAPGLGRGQGPMGQGGVRNEAVLAGPALNQITLPARDYATSVAFYRLLGLTQIVDSPSNGYARFEAVNGVTFSIHVDVNPVAGGAIIYLEMASLDVWHARLLSQGVCFDQPPTDRKHGWREARLTDPAGNRLCLYHAGEYRRFPPWRI